MIRFRSCDVHDACDFRWAFITGGSALRGHAAQVLVWVPAPSLRQKGLAQASIRVCAAQQIVEMCERVSWVILKPGPLSGFLECLGRRCFCYPFWKKYVFRRRSVPVFLVVCPLSHWRV